MGLRHSVISSDHRDMLQRQLVQTTRLAVAGVGVYLISVFYPTFYQYPYLVWGGWDSVARFWPLYLWAALTTTYVMYPECRKRAVPQRSKVSALVGGSITGTFAGIWEELGYRWIYVCYAMLGIAFANWFYSSGLGLVIAIGLTGIGLLLLFDRQNRSRGEALGCFALAVLAWQMSAHVNPVYWIQEITVYVVHWTTFTLMDSVLYGTHERLFIFGALMTNVWFRDGHRYQGWFGIVNSWYGGLILLYATVTYGLITAIAVHVIYDVLISVVEYALQKSK